MKSKIQNQKFKILTVFLIISGLILPSFSLAQNQIIKIPETLAEAKKIGEKALQEAWKQLPEIVEKIWEEQVLPVWQKMWKWFQENVWQKIVSLFQKEAEKRKPIIEEEFQKEKEELKEELPQTTKSLWEKLKEFLK
jgi:predicted PurR-regulated permease PerM